MKKSPLKAMAPAALLCWWKSPPTIATAPSAKSTTPPSAFENVLEAVKKSGAEVVHSEIGMIPQTYMKLEGAAANSMIRLLETLEDTDDVQNVYSNFDVD